MEKALIVATIINFIHSFEINDLKTLKELGYEIDVATNYDGDTTSGLSELDQLVSNKNQIDFKRSPFNIDFFKAFRQLYIIIKKGSYTLVHCHTPVGGILTRLSVMLSRDRKIKVIYTVHGFHFYKGAPLRNWLLYYPIEWICSFRTDLLITINKEDYERAKKRLHAKKTVYVPGVGIDVKQIKKTVVNREAKRKELGIPQDSVVILSVGELSKRKNHEIVIKALAKKSCNLYYLIAGEGNLRSYLEQLVKENDMSHRVQLLGQRADVLELYKASDLFILPSRQEGLPVALMEAMASGLVCIASKIRGNIDLIQDEYNGYLFQTDQIASLRNAIYKALTSDTKKIVNHSMKTISRYHSDKIILIMKQIYHEGE